MFGLGATEIIIVLVIALLVLGPKRLPDAARALGRGLGEFRRASSELRSALTAPLDEPEPPARRQTLLPASESQTKPPSPPPAAPAPEEATSASSPSVRPQTSPAAADDD